MPRTYTPDETDPFFGSLETSGLPHSESTVVAVASFAAYEKTEDPTALPFGTTLGCTPTGQAKPAYGEQDYDEDEQRLRVYASTGKQSTLYNLIDWEWVCIKD